jgi:hypothetical protein
MSRHERLSSLISAVQLYFDLMYDIDLANFERVFAPTVQLHGFRDGAMTVWPAGAYREVLAQRSSPKSLGAPRHEEILLIDFAADTQALVKVRVRINTTMFVDHLSYHRLDGAWRVTAKAFHVEGTV